MRRRPGPASRAAILAGLVGLLTLAAPGLARAHGEAPQLQQVLFHPTDSRVIVIVASFGLLVTEDGGDRWDWVCPEAISGDVVILGRGFLDETGAVVLGVPQGVLRGEALGCEWSRPSSELDGVYVTDVHAEPADRSFALALTFERDDSSRLFGTDDGGRSWAMRPAPLPARLLTQGVRAAPGDPLRVYASGVEPSGMRPFVFRSDGGGDAWTALPIDERAGEFAFPLLGVDPSDRDRVYLRAQEASRDRVAVSDDGAMSFRDLGTLEAPPLGAGRPFGFSIASDGTVWIGNPVVGLLRREGDALAPVRPELAVTCVESAADDLYVCVDGRAGDAAAELWRAPGGDTDALEPVMRYEQMSGVRSCPSAPSVRAICEPLWDDLRRHVGLLPPLDAGVPPPSDAGALDAGRTAADAGAPVPSEGCACHAGTPRGGARGAPILALAIAFLWLRRRGG